MIGSALGSASLLSFSGQPGKSGQRPQVLMVHCGPGPQWRPGGHEMVRVERGEATAA